jgi:hypothetical protein
VMVWVIHNIYKDQAKDTMIISSGLVNMLDKVSPCEHQFVRRLGLRKAKLWNIRCFILLAMSCVEKIKIVRFRIDSHNIKRSKRALHYVYLVPLVSSSVELCFGGD